MELDPEVEANVLTRRSTWRSRRSSYRVSLTCALLTDSSPRPGLTERAANVVGVCELVKKSDKQVAAVRTQPPYTGRNRQMSLWKKRFMSEQCPIFQENKEKEMLERHDQSTGGSVVEGDFAV
jgi:hypothetical protein